MLRNYFAAAMRNLFRNRGYAAINICGLALGFAAVILIALFVRDEYSYDRFFPGHERIFQVGEIALIPGQAPLRVSVTASDIAPALQLDFPQIDMTTRLVQSGGTLRRGDYQASAFVARWAEPNFFRMFPMKAISGDLSGALSQPDGIVLTNSIARRFFGHGPAVGETIELDRAHTMRVTAVIEDLPSNTHLTGDVFLPAIASFSPLTALDAVQRSSTQVKSENVYSYVRLKPGARVEDIHAGMRAFVQRHLPGEVRGISMANVYSFRLTPITGVHLLPPSIAAMKPPSDPRTLHAMIGIACLILFVAASNFVSMMTARAARRAVEVGVRKSVGATRRQIIAQFMGECLFYAGLALAFAMAAVNLILPAFNAFLQRGITFDFLHDPVLATAVIGMAVISGVAAGAYPALVLSAFRPNVVLKGALPLVGGSGRLRRLLVVFQFGVLITLIFATMTIQRQVQFAMDDRLHLPADQIFMTNWISGGCPRTFAAAVGQLQGVRAVSCASGSALTFDRLGSGFSSETADSISVRTAPVDYAFFDVFGIRPLAGRLLSPDHGEDDTLQAGLQGTNDALLNPSMIINETAVRALGFDSPAAAVGQYRRWARMSFAGDGGISIADNMSSQIVGVVSDFSIGSVRDVIEPTAYYVDPATAHYLVVNLDGRAIPQTLRAIRALWSRRDTVNPFDGRFLSQYMNDLYSDIARQSVIFSFFSGVAVMVAALGLLSLAVFTAEQRTREIGLRKVMGASRADILRFLGWQFARPVLWANVIAWPCAYFAMQHWLSGFAYHVDLHPLMFVAAGTLALVIALATVSGHALLVARARPVEALRYE